MSQGLSATVHLEAHDMIVTTPQWGNDVLSTPFYKGYSSFHRSSRGDTVTHY